MLAVDEGGAFGFHLSQGEVGGGFVPKSACVGDDDGTFRTGEQAEDEGLDGTFGADAEDDKSLGLDGREEAICLGIGEHVVRSFVDDDLSVFLEEVVRQRGTGIVIDDVSFWEESEGQLLLSVGSVDAMEQW